MEDILATGKKYFNFGVVLKCKRKKRGNGLPDKHKTRLAARGDQLARQYKEANLTPPDSYSPTVNAIIFALLLQLAVINHSYAKQQTVWLPTCKLK